MRKVSLVAVIACVSVLGLGSAGKYPAALDFQVKTITGDQLKLSQLRGQVVLIDFWASWCKPCQKEFPFLVELHQRYAKKGFTVVAINLDEHPASMKKFLEKLETKVPFPVVADPKGKLPELYHVEGMPTTVFIDRNGFVRYRQVGFEDKHKKKYESIVVALLGEQS